MSHRATLYAKELRICPNGERVSKLEKLVLYALADYHQDKLGTNTYPSVNTLAEESLMDERSCRRLLGSLERKGVIERIYAERQGRSHVTFYRFPQLDKPVETAQKGGHSAPLFRPPFLSERGTKGGQKGDRGCTPYKEEQEREQKQKLTPPTPSPGEGELAPNGNCVPIRPPTSCELAVDQAMQGCGFAARKLRSALRAVIELEVAKGDSPATAALAMIAAWKKYSEQDTNLRVKWGPRRFFEEGHWRDPRGWHWDNQRLREKRLEAEARVGSWG